MNIKNLENLKFFKLPWDIELVLLVIKEELKSRRLKIDLNKLDLNPVLIETDYRDLILSALGFEEVTVNLKKWYLEQLTEFSKDIDLLDEDTLSRETFNFYVHLTIEKRILED